MESITQSKILCLKSLISDTRKYYIKLYKQWKLFTIITILICTVCVIMNKSKSDLLFSLLAFLELIIILGMTFKLAMIGSKIKKLYVLFKARLDFYNYVDIKDRFERIMWSAKYAGDVELRNIYKEMCKLNESSEEGI